MKRDFTQYNKIFIIEMEIEQEEVFLKIYVILVIDILKIILKMVIKMYLYVYIIIGYNKYINR